MPSINLAPWKLTLPIGAPTEIMPPALASYDSSYFHHVGDAIKFWCPVTGSHTPNSSYPRTELREMNPNGTLAAWRIDAGTATLNATLSVDQLPSSGKVIVGQIHSGHNPLVKLVFDKGTLRALVRYGPDSDSESYTLASGIKLGQTFSYKLYSKVTPAGHLELRCQVNGETKLVSRLSDEWRRERFYFKAGAYANDNSGPSTEGARVTFHSLTVKHA